MEDRFLKRSSSKPSCSSWRFCRRRTRKVKTKQSPASAMSAPAIPPAMAPVLTDGTLFAAVDVDVDSGGISDTSVVEKISVVAGRGCEKLEIDDVGGIGGVEVDIVGVVDTDDVELTVLVGSKDGDSEVDWVVEGGRTTTVPL